MPVPISPLRYPGGKAVLVPLLSAIIRANRIGDGVYVEPYAGGAGAALGLLLNEHVRKIVINDFDYRIYCFWWSILSRTNHFLDLLHEKRISIAEWRRQREIYDKPNAYSKTRVGFATFFLNRCNRSGILVSGGPIGGFDQSGNYPLNARFNKANLAKRIERIAMYRERIELHNRDATDLLRRVVGRRVAAKETLVYLDPPYYEKSSNLYLNAYSPKDHADLLSYLSGNHLFKWVMTYDNVPEITALYRNFRRIPFDLSYSAHRRRVGRELLIHAADLQIPKDALPMSA